jgi:hypothetical protein
MNEKAISEQLTAIEILEKVWRWLVLVSFLGAGTIFIIDIDFQLLMGLIVIFEGAMNFFRIFNLSKKHDISRGNMAISTIIGTLITSGATGLFVYLFIIISLLAGNAQ